MNLLFRHKFQIRAAHEHKHKRQTQSTFLRVRKHIEQVNVILTEIKALSLPFTFDSILVCLEYCTGSVNFND